MGGPSRCPGGLHRVVRRESKKPPTGPPTWDEAEPILTIKAGEKQLRNIKWLVSFARPPVHVQAVATHQVLEALLVEAELTHTYFLAQILFGLSGIFPKSLLLPQGPHSNRSLERMFLFFARLPKADNYKRNGGERDRIGGWGKLVWD